VFNQNRDAVNGFWERIERINSGGDADEPGVRRLFLPCDGNPPVRGDVLPVALPGSEQLACDDWREDGAGFCGAGTFLPAPLRILDAKYQPGDGHLPLIGERPRYQRHLQR